MDENIRPCFCCEGAGCEECDGTGRRVTTFIEVEGGHIRVSGNASLSPEAVEAFRALAAAAAQMDAAGDE